MDGAPRGYDPDTWMSLVNGQHHMESLFHQCVSEASKAMSEKRINAGRAIESVSGNWRSIYAQKTFMVSDAMDATPKINMASWVDGIFDSMYGSMAADLADASSMDD